MTQVTEQQLLHEKNRFKEKNPGKFIEIFRSPHLYVSDDEVLTKINAVEQTHRGWKTILSGYIEENGGKRAVVLHYKP